jgi:voltage-gated potassium channel
MVVQVLLQQGSETWKLVNLYDNLICIIFLVDFTMHLMYQPVKKDYFIGQRGYLDLLGSIPSFGFTQFVVLLRLFRLSRLFRLRRLLNPQNRALLRKEILENRGSYALFFTVMLIAIVLMTASILVLFFETSAPSSTDPNITDGGDALWWSVVTITTVGYGDYYPKTSGGRVTGVFVMFAGVGIIGALASILASILVPQPKEIQEQGEDTGKQPAPPPSPMELELAEIKNELARLRQLLEKNGATDKEGGG